MAIVTDEEKLGLRIIFDDEMGWYIEGHVPYVPEDNAAGWVGFELDPVFTKEQVAMILLKLGYTLDQVAQLLEDF